MARWIPHENDNMDDDPTRREYRDIRLDYPGVDAYLQTQELGYRQGEQAITPFPLIGLERHSQAT